jgi:hypothetical protein
VNVKRWEYLIIAYEYGNDAWRPRFARGREMPDWDIGPTSHQFMDQLGEQGWECFDVEIGREGSEINSYWMYFKRPKM